MCIGDWRAGRLIRSFASVVTSIAGTVTLCNPNNNRVGLIIGFTDAAPTGTIFAVINGVNIPIHNNALNSAPLILTMKEHGDLVTRQFKFTSAAGATNSHGVTEFTMPEEMIASCLEQWKRDNLPCLK